MSDERDTAAARSAREEKPGMTAEPGARARPRARRRLRGPAVEMLLQAPSAGPRLTLLLVPTLLGAALAPVALTIANGRLVNEVTAAIGRPHGPAARQALLTGLLTAGLFLGQQVLVPVAQQTADALGRRLSRRLRGRVMAATLGPVGTGHLEDGAVLDLLTGAQGVGTAGTTTREALIAAANIGVSRLQAVGFAAVIAIFHWWLAALLLAGFLALNQLVVLDYRRGQRALMGTPARLRRTTYVRDFALRPEAAKELRIFGLQDWLDARFHREWRTAMAGLWRDREDGRWLTPLLGAGMLAVSAGGYAVLGLAAAHGEVSTGQFTEYSGALLGLSAVMAVGPDNVRIVQGSAPVPLVRELAAALSTRNAASPAAASRAEQTSTPPAPAPAPEISLRGVRFGYPGRPEPVFGDLDLEIPAGRSLAVVGVNGAGKTTLVKLLCGLRTAQAGSILIDGEPLTERNAARWQRQIGAVFQDFMRYELTAADNVALGAVQHAADAAGLDRSAELAGAADLIGRLDQGWDTLLSARFPGGRDLSGGEWQRLALARALFAVRHGARLLILDEPAAALDVRAEAELNDRILSLTRGVTSVVISHRFSTTRRADRIVVLEHGRVLESGGHEELMAAGGQYAKMFRLQAERFTAAPAAPGRQAAADA
jgi:ABC-type multidrug transport system fused ATPase/permease subunit